MIDSILLQKLYGRKNLGKWVEPIEFAMNIGQIKTKQEVATFLAQIGHESGRLVYTRELWGPTPQQLRYEGTSLAKTLGNIQPGDGVRYMGRGLIQTTGRTNYIMTTNRLRELLGNKNVPDFVSEPKKLEEPYWAAASAGLFWRVKNLNKFANQFQEQTRRINGGYHGLADRQLLLTQALILLQDYDYGT